MAVLEPLKEKIKTTDKLIDQIVYKLYNLTLEEIEIVEGKENEWIYFIYGYSWIHIKD